MTVAMAQMTLNNNYSSPTDVLGAHLLYGRGCIGCHAPHSGSGGNGLNPQTDPYSGNAALWGQDLTPLYNQTFGFGDTGDTRLPSRQMASTLSAHDAISGIMFCLSCHDGNLAKVGWMKGRTVETLPIVGGTAPTLLGNDGTTAGNYHNDHPVGYNAIIGCGGQYNWDCTISSSGKIQMNGSDFRPVLQRELWLHSQPGCLQQPTDRDLHHLPRPAQHDCMAGYCYHHAVEARLLPDLVLRPRPLSAANRRQQRGPVLPQLPRWRSQRNAQLVNVPTT